MKKNRVFNISVNESDRFIITELQKKYSVNVSGLVKNCIRDHYCRLQRTLGNQKDQKGQRG